MGADWRRFCSTKDLSVEANAVTVSLADGRKHHVLVDEEPDAYRLTATVVRRADAAGVENLPLETWERNRGTELVGFRIDQKGRLLGVAWVPRAGLTAPEFRVYVHAIAAECDRYEFQLTGRDAP